MEWILMLILILTWIFLIFFGATTLSAFRYGIPYIRTDKRVQKRMIELAQLGPNTSVVDLGCGDGMLLREARVFSSAAMIGIEGDLLVALLARFWCRNQNIRILRQNFFTNPLPPAEVYFGYLSPQIMEKIERTLWPQFPKGTLFISNTFIFKNKEPIHSERIGPYKISVYQKG